MDESVKFWDQKVKVQGRGRYNMLESYWTEFHQTFSQLMQYGTMVNALIFGAKKIKVTAWPRAQRTEAYRARRCASSSSFWIYLETVTYRRTRNSRYIFSYFRIGLQVRITMYTGLCLSYFQ